MSNLVFGVYSTEKIKIKDKGLVKYIQIEPRCALFSGGKYGNRQFGKNKYSIVERLINGMMRTEHMTGYKLKTYNIVKKAFEIISTKTKENPVQILVTAIENAAPVEEITRIQYGGIAVPKAVDISPSRRVDIAIRNICVGAISASHKNKKRIYETLADEIIKASRGDTSSFAVSKKEELERIASSAR